MNCHSKVLVVIVKAKPGSFLHPCYHVPAIFPWRRLFRHVSRIRELKVQMSLFNAKIVHTWIISRFHWIGENQDHYTPQAVILHICIYLFQQSSFSTKNRGIKMSANSGQVHLKHEWFHSYFWHDMVLLDHSIRGLSNN